MQQSARQQYLTYNSRNVDEPILEFAHSVYDGAHGLRTARYQRVEVLNGLFLQKRSIPSVRRRKR